MTQPVPPDIAAGCFKAGRCVFVDDPPDYCRSWCRRPDNCLGDPYCDPCQPQDCHHPACPVRGAVDLLRSNAA